MQCCEALLLTACLVLPTGEVGGGGGGRGGKIAHVSLVCVAVLATYLAQSGTAMCVSVSPYSRTYMMYVASLFFQDFWSPHRIIVH